MRTLHGDPISYRRPICAALVASAVLAVASPAAADEPAAGVFALPTEAPAAPASAHRSPGMRIAGMTITGVAIAGAIAGTVGWIDAATCDVRAEEYCMMGGAITGVLALPISFGLSAIGVPLWVVGTLPPAGPASAAPAPWVPSNIAIGPGTASFQWTF